MDARYVSHVWKVGFEFEPEMERGKIEERTVRKLIVDRKGEMRQIAMDLKQKFEMSISDAMVVFLLIP